MWWVISLSSLGDNAAVSSGVWWFTKSLLHNCCSSRSPHSLTQLKNGISMLGKRAQARGDGSTLLFSVPAWKIIWCVMEEAAAFWNSCSKMLSNYQDGFFSLSRGLLLCHVCISRGPCPVHSWNNKAWGLFRTQLKNENTYPIFQYLLLRKMVTVVFQWYKYLIIRAVVC